MRRIQVLLTAVSIACSSTALAVNVDLTRLVVEGDNVPGVGNVTRIDNLAVNNGGEWLVEADTDLANTDLDQVLIKNGALYLQENDPLPLPVGATLDTFDSVNLNNSGNSGWNFFLDGTEGTFDDSGVYFNTDLIIQESDTSGAVEFSPGTPYIGFFDVKFNNPGQIMIVASVDDPNIGSSVDRALVIVQPGAGVGGIVETVVAKEGDILPGQVEPVADFGTGPELSSFNDAGQILFIADLTGPTDTDIAVYLDDALLAQEGSPSPVGGRNYELLSSRGNGLNANGEYVFKANLDGDTTDDELIVKNGAVFRREGENIPAIGTFVLETFGTGSGPVEIDDDGNVVWYGDWSDPNTDMDSGLFWNDELIVQEGVTQIDGLTVDTITSGEDGFELSDDGRWLIFEATLVGDLNGAFLAEITGSSSAGDGPGGMRAAISAAPNPFAGRTTLSFTIPRPGDVKLGVYDVRGRLVRLLTDRRAGSGPHEIMWDGADAAGRDVPAGTYFVRLRLGGTVMDQRIVRLR